MLLLCSDLAIRSGTACLLGPEHYDAETGVLRYRTKYQSVQAVHVTGALRTMLSGLAAPGIPFVAQLNGKRRMSYVTLMRHFHKHCKALGITRGITFHDLRRTTARAVYNVSRDLRVVQALLGHADLSSTLWYMAGDLHPVPLSTLELAKMPTQSQGVQ